MGIIQGVDHLYTGKVERVDEELLQLWLAHGVVPVIPPLGFDGDGKTYRVNSDGVAVAVAEALKAIKLIFITSQNGLIHRGQLIRRMLAPELETLLQQDSAGFAPDMLSKAQYAVAADGRFLMNLDAEAQSGAPITIVLNWTAAGPR